MKFIHDQLPSGRLFRTLTIVEDFTRQCPALWADLPINGAGVVAVLNRLAQTHGLPQAITLDNGPEFTGKILHDCARRHGVKLNLTALGKTRSSIASTASSATNASTNIAVFLKAKAAQRGREPLVVSGSTSRTTHRRCDFPADDQIDSDWGVATIF